MNIAFVHGGFSSSGGIQRAVSVILNTLSKENDYKLFSIEYIRTDKDHIEIDHRVQRFSFYESSISLRESIIRDGIIQKTKNILKENHIDVVIACGTQYYFVAVMAGKLAGVKSVCWEHTNPKVCSDHIFQKQIRRFGMKHSDANVLITESAKKYYDSVKAKKNVLIYNPVDGKLFETSCPYDADSKKIISVGRLSYAKNYDLLIEIADNVLSKHTDWVWDIYGEGEELDRLQQLILKTSVSDRLTLKGNALNIYDLYPEYSFLVMTSRYEGFPMVLLEAAGKALPMVSFDIETGPNEIIVDDENGCLIAAGDAEAMAARIEDLISAPEKRKRMSDNAYDTAQRFSVERICEEWKTLIEELRTE